ncbi:MAG: hypothetical protein ABII79_06570 [bacterium]
MRIIAMTLIGTLFLTSGFVGCNGEDDNPVTPEAPTGIVGDTTLPPEITIIGLQPGDDVVKGTANNLDTGNVRVVLWAKTDRWYVQPWINSPYTYVKSDGSWESWTHPWWRMLALLVDNSYDPGAVREHHPANDPGVLARDEYPEPSGDRILNFSGYSWRVKHSDYAGPGPNAFSDSIANVWLDGQGLHLKTNYHHDTWQCAEVVLDHSLGYGTYVFQVDSRIDSLDYNAVFAGFVYESQSREIDIEFSRVLANPHNAQYVVQPWNVSGNIVHYDMPAVAKTSHRFIWTADSISFKSWRGHEADPTHATLIYQWEYTGGDIPPPGGERMRFNLWLFDGDPPEQNKADEVVVSSFSFSP